jgi:hypothetical protein
MGWGVPSFRVEEIDRISTKFGINAYAIQRNTSAVLFLISTNYKNKNIGDIQTFRAA